MYTLDTFQAQYVEEREAAELAKRLAKVQEQQRQQEQLEKQRQSQSQSQPHQQHQHHHQQPQQGSLPVSRQHLSPMSRSSSQQPPHHTRALSQALQQQRPSLSRHSSFTPSGQSTVLGNIFQNMNNSARSSSQPPFRHHTRTHSSGASTPAIHTPLMTPTRTMTQAQMEAAMYAAEKKRDADIVSQVQSLKKKNNNDRD